MVEPNPIWLILELLEQRGVIPDAHLAFEILRGETKHQLHEEELKRRVEVQATPFPGSWNIK